MHVYNTEQPCVQTRRVNDRRDCTVKSARMHAACTGLFPPGQGPRVGSCIDACTRAVKWLFHSKIINARPCTSLHAAPIPGGPCVHSRSPYKGGGLHAPEIGCTSEPWPENQLLDVFFREASAARTYPATSRPSLSVSRLRTSSTRLCRFIDVRALKLSVKSLVDNGF